MPDRESSQAQLRRGRAAVVAPGQTPLASDDGRSIRPVRSAAPNTEGEPPGRSSGHHPRQDVHHAGRSIAAYPKSENPLQTAVCRGFKKMAGNYLLSHTRKGAVPSAPEVLTSVFGMGTGITPPTWSPANFYQHGGRRTKEKDQANRAISTGSLLHCCFYTARLSTK